MCRRLRRTPIAIRKVLVSSFSVVFFGLAALGWGIDWTKVQKDLDASPTEAGDVMIYRGLLKDDSIDTAIRNEIEGFLQASESSYGWTSESLRQMVDARAFMQRSGSVVDSKEARDQAAAIKKNPMYRDNGEKDESNWIASSFEKLNDWITKMFQRSQPQTPNLPNMGAPNLSWLVWLVWILLGGVVLTFVVLAVRHFSWQRKLKRKATALLEEDEPERSLDEWLEQADLLTSQGKYREAVRCLYLACLLKFDEHGVARFIRGETNWEHLARIEASLKRPISVDFRPATQAFDRVWYGFHVNGIADVDRFRAWYQFLTEALSKEAA